MYNTLMQSSPDQQQGPSMQVQQQFPNQGSQEQNPAMRQQMLAKMMMQGGQPQQQQYVNGWAVKQSPLSGVGDMVKQLSQAYLQKPIAQQPTMPAAQQSFPVAPQGNVSISPLGV